MPVTTSEVRIGHERVFLALSDEHNGVSTRSSRGSLESVHALLALPHLRAETQVHLADAALERDLASFFGGLAEDWRGWEGARAWATYEGGLALACMHDRLGHISVSVELREYSGQGWLVRGDVPVDAGQLDPLARDLAAFVGGHS